MEQLSDGDPSRIGEYRLLGRLGEGGMGRVFLARTASGRRLAVKLLKRDLAGNPEFRARFAREVAAARQVGGLHTAQVVDADADADPPWLATEYIEGDSLQQHLRRNGPLAAEALRELGAGIAEGLAAIHRAGLVHRDLKPANVIMGADGPRIIDFGIARAVDSSTFTATGTVLGTFAYMAPEQIRADRAEPASDVFALGCVLVFAATGSSPFDASTIPAVMHRVLNEQPDLDEVPEELRELVEACLDKDSGNRPSPGEILARLALDDAEPPETEPSEDDSPENPSPETLTDETRVGAGPRDQTRRWPGGETVAEVVEPAGTPARKRISRRAMLIGGLAATGAAVASVRALWPESEKQPDDKDAKAPSRFVSEDGDLKLVAFSPDGKTLAGLVDADGEAQVRLWDVASGETRAMHGFGSLLLPYKSLAFRPDGKVVGACCGDEIRLWDVDSGAETNRAGPSDSALDLDFSQDGRSLAVAGADGLSIWDVATGNLIDRLQVDVSSVAFSPDGELIAGMSDLGDGGGIWRLRDGERVPGSKKFKGFGGVMFSPDGKTLVLNNWGKEFPFGLLVLDVESGDEIFRDQGHVLAAACQPDGSAILTTAGDAVTRRESGSWESTGTFDTKSEVLTFAISPDGERLAVVCEEAPDEVTLARAP